MAEESLKNKTVKGVGWSMVDNVAQYAVSFIVSIVLARLLSPDDYGLIGLISVFTVLSTTLITGGFSNAILRKAAPTERDYSTVFVINLVMSLLLYIVIFFCAPLIAEFFHRPELINLTRVESIGFLIGALGIVQRVKLTKDINFKVQTKITVIASVSSGAIGILMAILNFGVWSLVGQHISLHIISVIGLWVCSKWSPRLEFSYANFKELFNYGWKIMTVDIINSIWGQIYSVVIGKFYQPSSLGQYTRAKSFSDLFSNNLTNVVQRVSFPVLSTIQNEDERMKQGYKEIIRLTMFVTFISLFGLLAISKPMILVLIGDKWLPAASMLQITCLSAVFFPLMALNLNMLQVKGRSDLYLKLELIKKALAVGPILLGIFVDLYWMLWGSVIVSAIGYYLNAYYSGQFVSYSMFEQIKDIAPSFAVATVMMTIVLPISYIPISPFFVLFIQFCVGFLVIIALCKLFNLHEYETIVGIIRGFSPLKQK